VDEDDSEFEQLCDWVFENLGDDVPLHFTSFNPDLELRDKPPTPPETLHCARRMDMQMGLKYVYEGNIYSDGGNTICPGCKLGRDLALVALGDVEPAERRRLHEVWNTDSRFLHQVPSREAPGVGQYRALRLADCRAAIV
jgi:hypothetical protein